MNISRCQNHNIKCQTVIIMQLCPRNLCKSKSTFNAQNEAKAEAKESYKMFIKRCVEFTYVNPKYDREGLAALHAAVGRRGSQERSLILSSVQERRVRYSVDRRTHWLWLNAVLKVRHGSFSHCQLPHLHFPDLASVNHWTHALQNV